MFWAEMWNISNFFYLKTRFLAVKFSVYLNGRVFVMQMRLVKILIKLRECAMSEGVFSHLAAHLIYHIM